MTRYFLYVKFFLLTFYSVKKACLEHVEIEKEPSNCFSVFFWLAQKNQKPKALDLFLEWLFRCRGQSKLVYSLAFLGE